MDGEAYPVEAYLEHAAWVRRLARDLVRDAGVAEDLAQETWLAFLRATPDRQRPLRPWLSRVLRNLAATRVGRDARRRGREETVAREEAEVGPDLVARAEEQRRVAAMVLELPEPYRESLLMRYYEGQSPTQIARRLGISPVTVRTRLHRGIAMLRKRLDRAHGGDRKSWALLLAPQPPAQATLSAGALGVWSLALVAGIVLGYLGLQRFGSEQDPSVGDLGAPYAQIAQEHGSNALAVPQEPSRAPADPLGLAAQEPWLLIDPTTGRPLPHWEFEWNSERMRSDAKGRMPAQVEAAGWRSVDAAGAGTLVRQSHEGRSFRPAAEVRGVWDPELRQVRVAAGPELDLVWSSLVTPASGLVVTCKPAQTATSNLLAREVLAPLRFAPERGFWVRFPEGIPQGDSGWILRVGDREGLLSGERLLDEAWPTEPIPVDLSPTGAIAAELPSKPCDEVLLLARNTENQEVHLPLRTASGEFVFRWLKPGRYQIVASCTGFSEWRHEVEVHAGRIERVDPEWVPLRSAGKVSGVISSQSGTYRGQLLVFLESEAVSEPMIFPTTWSPTEEGDWRAPFHFDAVPEGPLRMHVISLADRVQVSGIPRSVEAPLEGWNVLVLDQEPRGDVDVALLDAETGAPLARPKLRVTFGEDWDLLWSGVDGERWLLHVAGMRWNTVVGSTPLLGWPWRSGMEWEVTADGYLPARGDERAVQGFGTPEARLEVRLERDANALSPR